MRAGIFAVSVAVVLAGLSVPAVAAPATVEAQLIDGSEFRLQGGDDRPLLLKFWATWCVACLQEMPVYIESFDRHGENIRFLAVNVAVSDPLDRVNETVEKLALKMPVAYDSNGELWDKFGVSGTPTYVLLGRDGNELYRSYGHDDKLEAALEHSDSSQPAVNGLLADSGQIGTGSAADTILDIDGNVIDLKNNSDVIVSYHLAVWCASYVKNSYPALSSRCREFDERIQALGKLHMPGSQLIGFVSTYSTDESSVGKFRASRNIRYPMVYDSNNAYAKQYGTRSFPHLTVVAPGGMLVYAGNQVPDNIEQIIKDASKR